MFEINESEDLSDMEYIAKFLAIYPDLAGLISPDKFPIFYQYPRAVVKRFRTAIEFMKNLQIPDEVIESEFEYYINTACSEVVNLMSKDSE